jgi:protein tyrosine phosphatase (PTP) superfamily phosphohydrolase (DUF442 family)
MNAPIIPKLPAVPPPLPMMTPVVQTKLWLQTIFIDHSFFRAGLNLPKRVGKHLYRAGHPMPYQLRQAQQRGIRSVINLRGSDDNISSNVLERAECSRIGLRLEHYALYSRAAPTKEDILGYAALLEALPKPILIHCKSGADRAGIGSALYLLLQEQATPEEAMKQLEFWPHGHIRQAKTGVLDFFLEAYRDHHHAHGTPFLDWVCQHYDPSLLFAQFQSQRWANKLVDNFLRRE